MTEFALLLVCVDLVGKMYQSPLLPKTCISYPQKFRILYKISLTVLKCLHGNAPDYLKELITLSESSCSSRTAIRINRFEPPAIDRDVKMSRAFKHCAVSV